MYVITKLIVLLTTIPGIVGPLAETWFSCECEFLTWAPWSDCTELCYGTQERDRKVQLRQYPGCDEFTDCASSDMGSEQRECNKFCHNGGTFASLSTGCSCVPGKEGRCCDNTVTCAPPPKPTNGEVSYNSLDYGSTATYSCHSDYNITSGSSSRTCQANGGWNGVTAQCQYVNTCSSNPCKNGGSCINGVESYTCQCQPGWSGINCENDVHPPVMTECSEDILIYTNETTHNVTWPIPQFSDPMNKEITMVTNYPESFVVAPWGDNVVQYVATKPFNGLQAECKFTVKVRRKFNAHSTQTIIS
ncbi:fibropellin-1 isoform X2 [Patella vulgata]|uniref:fibropellin-1 isoform X2 n=1 Tax=Patella vulgata TaxID=6465 RepID=UPI00217F5F99|nr:fibropellin-1 isoform X2 [Patella vulgata]